MKNIIFAFSVLLMLAVSSCNDTASDDITAGDVKVTVTLQTRGDDNTSSPAYNELIKKWRLVFVNSSGNVVADIEKLCENYTSEDTFTLEIMPGSYTIYAFANNADKDVSFGSGVPTDIDKKIWTGDVPGNNDDIPMTALLKNVDIRQQASRNIVVELVRLVAKMQLEITNATGKTLTVNKVSLLPALTDKVNLFPDYPTESIAPALPTGAVCTGLERVFQNKTLENGDKITDSFYLPESTAAGHPTGHYVVKIEITGDGRDETMTALTSNLEWIRRNDFIILPLKIVDCSLKLDVSFYPPIGGYPAALLESKGDEYYATFGSSGKFVIRPTLTDGTGSVIPPEKYSVFLTTSDPAGILIKTPAVNVNTKELTGELATGNKAGTAVVSLDIKYEVSKEISYLFTRTLYIIRK